MKRRRREWEMQERLDQLWAEKLWGASGRDRAADEGAGWGSWEATPMGQVRRRRTADGRPWEQMVQWLDRGVGREVEECRLWVAGRLEAVVMYWYDCDIPAVWRRRAETQVAQYEAEQGALSGVAEGGGEP